MAPLYYLSFQKAPPRTVTYGQTIAVAPTIYNDLREDVYEPAATGGDGEVEIVLAWLVEGEGDGAPLRFVERAACVAWSGAAQAYKPMQLTAPSLRTLAHTRSTTKRLRLALYVDRGDEPWSYMLGAHSAADEHTHAAVFVPALSATVFIGNDDDDRCTNRIVRCFQLAADASYPAMIRMEEQAGYHLEGHLWDAALHLVHWLLTQQQAGSGASQGGGKLFRSTSPLRVLELGENKKRLCNVCARVLMRATTSLPGAGTGLVSIALAVALAQSSGHPHVSISATDLPSAMEVLQSNVQANQHLFANRNVSLSAHVLDWDDDGAAAGASLYDVILIADCTYNPRYFGALCRAIRNNLQTSEGRCLLAKKHRHVDEDSLWGALAHAGLHVQRIAGRDAQLAVDSEHVYVGWGLYMINMITAK